MPPDALDIAQEGLRVPPVRLTPEVEAVIVASSRTPDERRGDLDAQRGANVVGVGRLRELIVALGDAGPLGEVARLRRAPDARRARRALPERSLHVRGRARLRRARDPRSRRRSRVVVAVTIDGRHVTFDFTGSARAAAGNVNAVEAVTVSAVAFAIRVGDRRDASRRTAERCAR